ncbi:non-hemolytic enterotoxin subunit B [Bacillus arachidis]|uniref:Alpha-helical pore-forming toxin family protein n=1 Tax=Bacillus arachidis TaxID=2819290 RepID=A0ABS3P2S5_9BACI|nr:HBL/NHE enterotoxin family protein [Bacillus arachidis]MBO1627486.1 alpha-helical pore-forming toxin family protein [Bacillus arachidis]WIY59328.1 HBL/NHE enterotoxin family protein [Bacillus arachidis]
MAKKPYKVMALSTLIATMAAANIMPTYASAAENTAKPAAVHAKAIDATGTHAEYSLGPDGLREALEKTGSNVLTMDLYALTILKQANANFNDITTIDDALKAKIIEHQKLARGNANEWLDTLKPQLISTNENIINYSDQFKNYYKTLQNAVDIAVEKGDTEKLTAGLTQLTESISANKKEVDDLVKQLKSFRSKMASDTQSFKDDANQITSVLASQDAGIPLLEKQISANMESINKNNAILISASVSTALGPMAIIGGVALIATGVGAKAGAVLITVGVGATALGVTGVVLAKQEIDRAQGDIQKLTGDISNIKLQVVGLTNLKKQTESLSETIDIAIDSLQNISNQWQTMGSKYNSLLKNVNKVKPNQLGFIKENLQTANDSWEKIQKYAEDIQNSEIKVAENN